MLSVHYRLWNRGRVLPIIESVMGTRMARTTDLRGLFEPRYRPRERQLTVQSSRLPQVKTNSTCPIHRPEWPSPHDCTSSVSDELVLIQLLNLVQSQRLSHIFFLGPPFKRFFFFTCGPHLLTQLPCSKKKFPPTLLLYLCYRFFSKALFFFVVIVNATTM
jgi:hypothetical protein